MREKIENTPKYCYVCGSRLEAAIFGSFKCVNTKCAKVYAKKPPVSCGMRGLVIIE